MKKSVYGFAAALAVGFAAQAQAQVSGVPVYLEPECEVDTKHFLVRQASLYVKSAAEASSPEDRNQSLQDAFRVLNEAIERGEAENGSMWYFMGRAYHMVPDYPGTDSAFARAEELLPECVEDTEKYRYDLWVRAYNFGVEALQADSAEQAQQFLTQANTVYHKEPNVPYYLASVEAQLGMNDLAIEHFKERVAFGESEGEYKESYDLSVFNIARLYHMRQAWDSAAVWYESYREINPDDPDGLQGLAAAYEGAGRSGDAAALFSESLGNTEGLSGLDLFSTGVSLFQAQRFDDAARAFALGLEKNPYHRDGRYNLAQAYFAIANPTGESDEEPSAEEQARRDEAAAQMLEAAQSLIEVDFFSESSMQLLAAAYQMAGNDDSTLAVIERLAELQFDLAVISFQASDDGAEIDGEFLNRMPDEITVPAIKFDFVDAMGNVVTSEILEGRTLAPDETSEFRLSPQGAGIVAWVYGAHETP